MIQHAKFLFNGVITEDTPLRCWPSNDELLVADGLFETIKVMGGRPIFFPAHHARLSESCRALALPWSLSAADLRERCDRLLAANGCQEGSLKVVVYRAGDGCGELVFSRDPAYSEDVYHRGFRLKTEVDSVRAPGPSHKSTKYLKNLRAREAARASGFDDALFIDARGRVLEGAATNIFLVKGGQLFTPTLAVGILPGVIRGEIVRRWSGGVNEQELSAEMLSTADEVFVTNALLGVMPVVAIDQHLYPISDRGVTARLIGELSQWSA